MKAFEAKSLRLGKFSFSIGLGGSTLSASLAALIGVALAAQSFAAEVQSGLARGLRLYYDFEESGSGGLANKAPVIDGLFDAVRFGGGEFTGGANPSGPGFAGKVDFDPGDGASDRSELLAGNALNLVDSRNDALVVPISSADLGSNFTLSLWHALTPSGSSTARPFVFEGSDSQNVSWGISSGDNYTAYVTQGAAVGGGELERGEWQHVAQVFSREYDAPSRRMTIRLRLYVNGELVGEDSGAANSMRFSALHLGKHRGGTFDRAWDGMFDEIAMWARALSEDEVRTIYEMGREGTPLSSVLHSFQGYQGQVFVSGRGERVGKEGVSVSDGFNVVKTDADGRYELPDNARARFISVTVPSGYRTVGKHYIRIRENLESFDFELFESEIAKGDKARFLQLTDTETGEDTGGWVGSVRDHVLDQEVDFIIHTGDICYGYGMPFHAENINSRTMGVPVFYCLGNHDLEQGVYGEELFEDLFGPVYYSFEVGNTHFIVTPMLGGTHRPSFSHAQIAEWMKQDLANKDPDKNLVVFNHFWSGSLGNDFNYGPGNAGIRLNDYNLKAWIYGHLHANYKRRHGDTGIISVQSAPAVMGGINHGTGNTVVYDMDGEGNIDLTAVYMLLDEHIVLVSPRENDVAHTTDGKLTISVNTYDSHSPVAAVEARIDRLDGWQPLNRNSDWNWSLDIEPQRMRAGSTYQISVRATKANGDTFTVQESFVYGSDDRGQNCEWRMEWVRNTGANSLFASPIIHDGVVYVSAVSVFDHENNRIMAYDLEGGELIWQTKVPSPIHNALSFDSGRLLGTDQEGVAYAWEAETGELAWSRPLGRTSPSVYVSGGTARDGIYYTGYGNYLSAVNVADGNVVWRSTDWNHGYSGPAVHTIAADVLLVGAQWGALHAHDLASGAPRWTDGASGIRNRSSTPGYYDGRIFIMGSNILAQSNPVDGEHFRLDQMGRNTDVAGRPLVNGERIIAGTAGDGLVSFDTSTGEQQWHLNTEDALVHTSPYTRSGDSTVHSTAISLGDQIIFGASDGNLYVAQKDDGAIAQRIRLGAPIMAEPVLTDTGELFVKDFGGNLYKFTRAG